jgi:hypothetical protein
MDMGLDEQSIVRQEQALRLFQTIRGTEREQAGCLLKTAVALGQMGKHREAVAKARQIDELQQQRNLVEAELKRTALGRYVAPRFRKPTEVGRELPATSALLQYSTADKNGWLLMLTRDGVHAFPVGVPAAALPESSPHPETGLEELARAWKERPDRVGLDGLVRLARARAEDLGSGTAERRGLIAAEDEQALLDRLGDALLPRAALTELRQRGIKHLVVIPDGTLHYVPFAALRVRSSDAEEKRYLIEEFAISHVPAMTTLETIRAQKQERQKT